MSDKTKIEWTDATWNPVRGCSRVSEGCRNCYAEGVANRFKGENQPYEGLIARTGQWNGEIKFIENGLFQPLRWRKPRMIFVNSMSDLFHENLHIEYIAKIFAVMYLAHWHTFQVLTKRAERMHEILNNPFFHDLVLNAALQYRKNIRLKDTGVSISDPTRFPHKNVWLGVSVENQETANQRVQWLMDTPAAVRWVSAEPLLGPVDLTRIIYPGLEQKSEFHPFLAYDTLRGHMIGPDDVGLPKLDWVVVGGESGSYARPMHPDWARSLKDQCVNAGVPFFFKQWGEFAPNWCNDDNGQKIPDSEWIDRMGKRKAGRELDGRTWDEFPKGL